MRVQDCIVSVRRRSVGSIIDLAFVFTRQFGAAIFFLSALIVIPSSWLVWQLCHWYTEPLLPSMLVFAVFSAFLSGAIIAGIGPQVFGVPLTVTSALSGVKKRGFAYSFWMTIVRLIQAFCSFCFFWPILLITPYVGHIAEILFLEQAPMGKVTSRLGYLAGSGGYMRNFGRSLLLILLWLLVSAGLFVTFDLVGSWLFGFPILFNRLGDSPDAAEAVSRLLSHDPVVITTLHIAIWLPFPMIRLAWFFCYLDQRIRSECWDIELQYRIEAERLEGLE